MKKGDMVSWSSQSQGYTKTKNGRIIQVVPAGTTPIMTLDDTMNLRVLGAGFGMSRKHESYLVQVGNVAYWPVVNRLVVNI